jgi:hypothetical protein
VTRDYFRYDNESSEENEHLENGEGGEEEQRGDFVAGGIYAPPAHSLSSAAASLTTTIANAAGIKKHLNSLFNHINGTINGASNSNAVEATAATSGEPVEAT